MRQAALHDRLAVHPGALCCRAVAFADDLLT
jgi:hypothetical protein